jgi:hypothetical protein
VNIYRERVLPSIGNLALPFLLFVSVFTVMLPVNTDFAIPIAALFAVGLAVVMFLASPVVVVTENELFVKGARIEKRYLGAVAVIPSDEIFETLGRNLNANAWLSIQASVKGLVRVEITDEEDSSPYWLISTRNPEALAKALKD